MCRALNRRHIVVNLDPSNDQVLPYDCTIDIRRLVGLFDTMKRFKLGPNGAMIYCIEYLLENIDWLKSEMDKNPDCYLIVDCPGQVELYTHHEGMRLLLRKMTNEFDCRLTAVHLVDCTMCTDPFKYVSAILTSLSGEILLELPHVNVLSKIDLLKRHSRDLDFRIEYYAEAEDLSAILHLFPNEHPLDKKFYRFTKLLVELLEDYNYVTFQLLVIEDKLSVLRLLRLVDRANGFCLSDEGSEEKVFNTVLPDTVGTMEDMYGSIQEKYIDTVDDG